MKRPTATIATFLQIDQKFAAIHAFARFAEDGKVANFSKLHSKNQSARNRTARRRRWKNNSARFATGDYSLRTQKLTLYGGTRRPGTGIAN
jgi:hypothetical protein